jgi:MFS family permease
VTQGTTAQTHGDPPTESAELVSNRRKAVTASGIGWGLDGFTWTMYGFALPAATAALGMSSGAGGWITAVSIVASAAGGLLFGNLADRFGRVKMLSIVILGYAVFTALTATSQAGWQFLMWRLLEGLFFGGEWAVGAALVAEYARPSQRGRQLSIVQSCYAVGWAASTLAYLTLYSVFPAEQAWRYLFLVGILPALAVFWIRRSAKDATDIVPATTTDDTGADASGTAAPAGGTVRKPVKIRRLFAPGIRRHTIFGVLLGIGVQGIYYSVFVFLPSYLQQDRGLGIGGTATFTWFAILGSFIGYLSSGWFLDSIGRRRTFFFFFVGSAASTALFVFTPSVNTGVALFFIVLLGFFSSGQAGGTGAYLAELFPTEIRATGQALTYNLGRGLAAFGPLSIGILVGSIGWGKSIFAITVAGAVIGSVALAMLPETKNAQLVDTID